VGSFWDLELIKSVRQYEQWRNIFDEYLIFGGLLLNPQATKFVQTFSFVGQGSLSKLPKPGQLAAAILNNIIDYFRFSNRAQSIEFCDWLESSAPNTLVANSLEMFIRELADPNEKASNYGWLSLFWACFDQLRRRAIISQTLSLLWSSSSSSASSRQLPYLPNDVLQSISTFLIDIDIAFVDERFPADHASILSSESQQQHISIAQNICGSEAAEAAEQEHRTSSNESLQEAARKRTSSQPWGQSSSHIAHNFLQESV
jgi:hypothetical protein